MSLFRGGLTVSGLPGRVCLALLPLCAGAATGATFGSPVAVPGRAAGIALDEARGAVYVSNASASRVDILSIADRAVRDSVALPARGGSLSVSPDGRFLAVALAPGSTAAPAGGIAVIALDQPGNVRVHQLDTAPLALAFGGGGLALVITASDFRLFDPVDGSTQAMVSVEALVARTPPQPDVSPATFSRAAAAASGDGAVIYVLGETTNGAHTLVCAFSAAARDFVMSSWVLPAPSGPLTLSTDAAGSGFVVGPAVYDSAGVLLAQFPVTAGESAIAGHAIDGGRNLVYMQLAQTGTQPLLLIADADNLTVRERLLLPENLAGEAVLDSAGNVMYGISGTGILILPVGSLDRYDRVVTSGENMLLSGSWCAQGNAVREFKVENPGGGHTPFSVSTDVPGVTVTASSPTTPALVRIAVDTDAFKSEPGTTVVPITITSPSAVNVISPVQLNINVRAPDQRGTIFNVPGNLVDILPDPYRNRFYVLREDRNEVQIYDAADFSLTGTLRTGNTPVTMAMTDDGAHLIVGCDNSEAAFAFNLDTLALAKKIVFPRGHFPRSIAVSKNVILAASRVFDGRNTIDRVFFESGVAFALPSLGAIPNVIDANTLLLPSPAGGVIFGAMASGTMLVYDLATGTFTVRPDFPLHCGSIINGFSAFSDNLFVAGRCLFNASLDTVGVFNPFAGIPAGFTVINGFLVRIGALNVFGIGAIERLDVVTGFPTSFIRLSEAPKVPDHRHRLFPRTLAPLPRGEAVVSLSTSGFMVLPADYEAGPNAPRVRTAVNSADFSTAVAPGGLISIFGDNLSSVTASASQTPLPTLLGDTCITINDQLAPLLFVSPNQINAQLPFEVEGTASLVLHGPAAASSPFEFQTQTVAPALFNTAVEGWPQDFPVVYRRANNQIVTLSNPIHPDDWLDIYCTGLGPVSPAVATGAAGLADPLSVALWRPVVTLGGTTVPVLFAGLEPGSPGVYRISIKAPLRGRTGMEVPLTITQGGFSTSITVRVVD
ncbi:MAG: hypothetical protein ACM3ZB_05790 [bacterium]|jgi:uncharacterized protein (TIGR03437 family)